MKTPLEPLHSKKPMYEDAHVSCSVLLAKIRNGEHLLQLQPHDQFRWLHRFYLVLDRIAEQHRVYKLYGGPHGFMISTGVAEPDGDHAITLLHFSLHLLQASQSIRVTGSTPLNLIMVMASGPACSGLLGTTSLTYQIVGKSVTIAHEIMETQLEVPFIVTSGMYREIKPEVAAELALLGSIPLRCCPGEEEPLFSLPRYASMQLTRLTPVTAQVAALSAPAANEAEADGSLASTEADCAAAAGDPQLPDRGGPILDTLPPCPDLLEADLLLRFEDPLLESAFAQYNGEAHCMGEMAWLGLSLLTVVLYGLILRGATMPLLRIARFQLLPVVGGLLCHFRRPTYLRYREVLWFVQRLLVLVSTSLPTSFVFAQPSAPLFAFGLCNLGLEILTRRLRLHLQLLSSLLIYATTLTLMNLHPEGSVGRMLVTPGYMALHLAVTVVFPVLTAASSDYITRRTFQAHVRREVIATETEVAKMKEYGFY